MKNQILKAHVKLINLAYRVLDLSKECLGNNRGEFGIGSVLSIVAALVIAAFIFIPGLRNFADGILTAMNSWWTNTMSARIFPTS